MSLLKIFLSIITCLFLNGMAMPTVSGHRDLTTSFSFNERQVKDSSKKQVVILCYHHIRDSLGTHSPAYSITVTAFRSHIQMLRDSGYATISPDQLYDYFAYDSSLPAKPAIISFDDGYKENASVAAPILDSFGFKGLFFIPVAFVGTKGCMDEKAIKKLSLSGHFIGNHSWSHPDLRKADSSYWDLQIDSANAKLQRITGKSIRYFAYPYGEWTEPVILQLKKRNFVAAFQLTRKQNKSNPLFTIRRLAVPGDWSPDMLNRQIKKLFLSPAVPCPVL